MTLDERENLPSKERLRKIIGKKKEKWEENGKQDINNKGNKKKNWCVHFDFSMKI